MELARGTDAGAILARGGQSGQKMRRNRWRYQGEAARESKSPDAKDAARFRPSVEPRRDHPNHSGASGSASEPFGIASGGIVGNVLAHRLQNVRRVSRIALEKSGTIRSGPAESRMLRKQRIG